MPEKFSNQPYDFCAVFKYSASGKFISSKQVKKTTENAITFTDDDVSKHDYFRIHIFHTKGGIMNKELWNRGMHPESIKFTLSDGTVKEYEVQVLE